MCGRVGGWMCGCLRVGGSVEVCCRGGGGGGGVFVCLSMCLYVHGKGLNNNFPESAVNNHMEFDMWKF